MKSAKQAGKIATFAFFLSEMNHKSGFVAIAGKPNAGKSTLMNALLDTSLSAVTPKVQTTRHRIKGILNGPGFQIVFSDTPGILTPAYRLHEKMMDAVDASLEDADVILLVVDVYDKQLPEVVTAKLKNVQVPVVIALNKVDVSDQPQVQQLIDLWETSAKPAAVIALSALHRFNLEKLVEVIKELLPENPPYYDADELSDRDTRFFVTELIRETLLTHYDKEVPYSCEVTITTYEEQPAIDRIFAEISVARESQKAILLGKGGSAIKSLGMESRKKIEKLTGKKVYLDLTVKVRDDWRNDDKQLNRLGYQKEI